MTAESSSGIDFNHWLYRFLALVIDSIIIGIPVYIIWNFVFWSIFWSGAWWVIGYGSWLILPFIFGIIQLFYFVILDVAWGATIGKRILGLKVQMTNGGKVQFGQAFLRNVSKIYWLFLLLDWIIGIATPGPDRRQKYTDRMAGTTVIQVKQVFAAATQPPPPPPPPPPS
ncbi:MAG: RDD family protein [Candidatus Bathyarchaeota archaeon]|nr:RDD family protein [Candidatus Bathyarchaeota archaeon]